jgi:hypothetical protein
MPLSRSYLGFLGASIALLAWIAYLGWVCFHL